MQCNNVSEINFPTVPEAIDPNVQVIFPARNDVPTTLTTIEPVEGDVEGERKSREGWE